MTIAVEEEKVVVEESVKEEQVLKPVAVEEQPKELPLCNLFYFLIIMNYS